MKKRNVRDRMRKGILFFSAVALLGGFVYVGSQFGNKPIIAADTPNGPVKSVIVKFKDVTGVTNPSNISRQQAEIEAADQEVANATPYAAGYKMKTRSFDNLPYAVYSVDAEGEAALKADPNVESVKDDQILSFNADVPIPTIGGAANGTFTDGTDTFTGDGYAVAVIDTGVDKNHPLLAGKVIAEACFGINETYINAELTSLCPGQAEFSDAVGSGQDCTLPGCGHGTPVAGAAVMPAITADIDEDTVDDNLSGVAIDADIVAIKVAVQITSPSLCPTDPDNICASPFESVYLAALDYVATLSTTKPIAAVNLSMGNSGEYAETDAECNAFSSISLTNSAATALRAYNIAPVVSNGNDGDLSSNYGKIKVPACASNVIAVGATNVLGTEVASYSNNGPLTDLLAPGGDWDGSNQDSLMFLPENGTSGLTGEQGTSFAAPMVAGAYAVLREAHPNASVSSLTSLLQSTGTDVVDDRTGYDSVSKKLIDVSAALAAAAYPEITSFTGPSGTVNEGAGITLEAEVANATSCSLNNGVGNVTIVGGAINTSVPGAASYTLTCVNAYGDSVEDTLNFTLNPAPTVPAINSQVYDETARTFTLTWAASTDDDGVEEYRVFKDSQLVATLANTATQYTFTDILPDTTYTFAVRAVDTLGAISTAASVTYGDSVDAGVPNTGAFLIETGAGRAILVAFLGVVTTVTIITLARRTARSL